MTKRLRDTCSVNLFCLLPIVVISLGCGAKVVEKTNDSAAIEKNRQAHEKMMQMELSTPPTQ